MENIQNNKGGKIVLLIFLLICSGLGIAAFTMSFRNCKDGFKMESPQQCFGKNNDNIYNFCEKNCNDEDRPEYCEKLCQYIPGKIGRAHV